MRDVRNEQHHSNSTTGVTIGLLVGMILLILLLSLWARVRRRNLSEAAAIIYTRPVREPTKRRLSHSGWNSIPLIRYGSIMKANEREQASSQENKISQVPNKCTAADNTTSRFC